MTTVLLILNLFISVLTDTQTYVMREMPINSVRADSTIPITQKTISKDEITKDNFGQEMPYQLSKTPSITFQSDGGMMSGYSYLRLRGIDQTRINFTLNGIPLNEPEDQGAYFSNYADFMSSIQSVQIQRGVGTSTNGSASYGGSVNLELQSLSEKFAEIDMQHGSYNSYRYSFAFGTGISKNNLGLYVRASNVSTDGYRNNSGNSSQSVIGSVGYFGKSDILRYTFIYGRERCNLAYIGASINEINDDPRFNPLNRYEIDNFHQSISILQYDKQFNENYSLSSQIYYNHLSGNYLVFAQLDTMEYLNFNLYSDWIGVISNMHSKFGNITFDFGIHANMYSRTHYLYIGEVDLNSPDFYRNKGNKQEFSAFSKLSYLINDLTFYTDMQYRFVHLDYIQVDGYSNQFVPNKYWQFFNPKIGVNYNTSDNIELYSYIGLMNREPARYDLLQGNDDATGIISFPDSVKSEQVVDLEIGTNIKFANFNMSLNLYNMQFTNENAIIGKMSLQTGLQMHRTVEHSFRRGIESDMSYKYDNLTVYGNVSYNYSKASYNYSKSNDTTKFSYSTSVLSPEWIVNNRFDYDVDSTTFTLNLRYVGESYLNLDYVQNSIPSSFITDVSIKTRWNRNSITLFVNNVFNKLYYTGGYMTNVPLYYVQAPANYSLLVRVGI